MPASGQVPPILIVTGGMAAGKSTVADALARRLPRAVHLRGDVFRRMIVSGQADMSPELSPEAARQLTLRYDLGCLVADTYAAAGFCVIYQDIILGEALPRVVHNLARWQPGVVVLAPGAAALAERDRRRAKTAYGQGWTPELMIDALMSTPRLGLWLDSTSLSVEQTADRILASPSELRHGISASGEP